jgi:Tfp pilus assembly protein PilN
MKNNFQKILLFLSSVFFIAVCLAFVFLYQKINKDNQKIELNTKIWQEEARRRDEIRSLDASLQKIADDRALLETHFAKSSNIVPFLDTIEKLAPKVNASAEVKSVDAVADKTKLIVGLKALGSFEALYKFLNLLENSPYEIEFLSLDIHKLEAGEPADKNAKGARWEAVFKIKLLSFIP